MATDLADKDLKKLRNDRWDKTFSENQPEEAAINDMRDRKATIVIEHLIQASDVSHTMQHWHVYRKWNENLFRYGLKEGGIDFVVENYIMRCHSRSLRLFREMYQAYRTGRADKNPADFWYVTPGLD